MWIITHDNVHEAGSSPAHTVPKSKDYLDRVCRKKNAARKHIFRLMHKGREMFRGVAYFENDASFSGILRPLDEFGRSEYDCDEIQYMIRELGGTPAGRQIWNSIHEEGGRQIDQLIAEGRIKNMQAVLAYRETETVCELDTLDVTHMLLLYDPSAK